MALEKANPTQAFNGQTCIIIFDEVTDYSKATLSTILKNGFEVGQVFEGTTAWNGEEPTFEDTLDEQGDVIISAPKKGTYGFDFSMADYSADKFKRFLNGKEIEFTTAEGSAVSGAGKAISVSSAIPVITRPVGIVNDEGNRLMLIPKARIITGPSMENKAFSLKSIVKAQECDTANLGTLMVLDNISL